MQCTCSSGFHQNSIPPEAADKSALVEEPSSELGCGCGVSGFDVWLDVPLHRIGVNLKNCNNLASISETSNPNEMHQNLKG